MRFNPFVEVYSMFSETAKMVDSADKLWVKHFAKRQNKEAYTA